MWSDRHYYLNIYKDTNLSSFVATNNIRTFLDGLSNLKKADEFTYENSCLKITLLFAKSFDSWSSMDSNSEMTNLINIICSKSNKTCLEQNKGLLIKIASFLHWQLVDEEKDDGIEDLVILQP